MSLPQECRRRYGSEDDMPISVEVMMGSNWLDTEGVYAN
jgi:hypothetical protein